jgi:hypothetical protein
MNVCRLCGEPKTLLMSHVVPEFFYKPVYDAKHRIHTRHNGRLAKTPPLQKGLRERLLCWECEQYFSRLESCGRETLFGNYTAEALRPYVIAPIGPLKRRSLIDRVRSLGFWTKGEISLTGVDYRNIRLFGLSLLWRMAIASNVVWRRVDLGSHEYTVRKMLTSGDAGQLHEFPFVCIVPLFDGRLFQDFILQPDCVEASGGLTVRVVLGGYLFVFLFGGIYNRDSLASFFVRPDGRWTLPIVDAMDLDFLRHDAKKMKAAIRAEVTAEQIVGRERR